jgi:hypothetical protein
MESFDREGAEPEQGDPHRRDGRAASFEVPAVDAVLDELWSTSEKVV